jgi:uncharacterized protein (TIGR02270 family)
MDSVQFVTAQYADQAGFLWQLRALGINDLRYTLADLARLDGRVEAHLDGLRVSEQAGLELERPESQWKEAGEAFATGVLSFENGDPARIEEVLRVAAAKPELARGVISALGWMDYDQAAPHIQNLCTSELRSHRRIGIAAAAVHRRDPGRPLEAALTSGDRFLRARAFKAVGELGRRDLIPLLQSELRSPEPGCRFWAAWSTALIAGYRESVQVLQRFAEEPGPYRERALQLAVRRMPLEAAHAWLAQASNSPRMSVIGAGITGDPVVIPWLMQQMEVPDLSRVAGEAFSLITGADLAYEDLDRKKPEDFQSGPTEDPQDDDVAMDADDRLPWPNPALIAHWWAERQSEYQPGIRHLLGKPITEEWAERVLRIGKQRQRAAAALELALLRPGSVLFEVRAPGFRQQEMLNYRNYR